MPINKYIIRGILSFDSGLHVGGGTINESNTDSPIVKTPNGLPYIPGSSMKGTFRSFVERVAAQLSDIKTCQLNSDYLECLSVKEKWSIKNKSENEIMRELSEGLCDTCKLFGSPHKASKVFFKDLYITEWAEMTQVRDGVVIDRDSGTGVPNLKYDYEVLPTDSSFSFEMSAENLDDTDLALLAVGVNELLSGDFQLGGKTTRGLGNCTLKNLEILISDWEDPNQFKNYILNQTDDTKFTKKVDTDARQFLTDKINTLFEN